MGEFSYCDFTSESQITERIGDADIVLLNKVKLSRDHLGAARKLKLIVLVGHRHRQYGFKLRKRARHRRLQHPRLLHCVGGATRLGDDFEPHPASHRLRTTGRATARGPAREFTVLAHPIRELAGRTLGIVGWGELGRAVAKAADAFGMRVIICNRPGAPAHDGRVALDALLETADIVSLHCPLDSVDTRADRCPRTRADEARCLADQYGPGSAGGRPALAAALKSGRLGRRRHRRACRRSRRRTTNPCSTPASPI